MQKEYTWPPTRPLAWGLVLGAVMCMAACMGNGSRPSSTDQDATMQISDGGIAPAARRDASGARGASRARESSAAGLLGLLTGTGRAQGSARIVPSGTVLTLTSNARVCTNTYHPGDTFTGTVMDTVTSTGGGVVPGGALADFQVTEPTPSPDASRGRRIGIALDSLAIDGVRYPARARITSIVTRKVRSTPSDQTDIAPIGVGAEAADILGVILSHSDRSTVIGARQATGDAGAGTATTDFCIPRNGRITLTLTEGERLQ